MKIQISPAAQPLRILCIGAGAVGIYIGGSLSLSGHQVVFLGRSSDARPETRQLNLRLGDHKQVIHNPVFAASIQQALSQEPFDLTILAVKSYNTPAVLETLAPFSDKIPPILCLQNGVENETLLAAALGKERVIPGTVTSAIGKPASHEIVLERLRGVGISSLHPLSVRLQAAFNQAGLNAVLIDQPESMKWSKLLTNLVANASSAILGMTPGEVFSHPGLFQIEARQLRETLAVMKAQRIPVIDLPGVPVRLMSLALRALPLPLLRPLLAKAVVGGRGDKMPSFYIDLQASRQQSEVTYLNGAVARWAEKLGLPAPANRFLTETLVGIFSGQILQEKYRRNPSALIRDFRKISN